VPGVDSADCPLCRKPFQIPASGVAAFQHNFFIEGLISVEREASTAADRVPNDGRTYVACETCASGTDFDDRSTGDGTAVAVASVFCVDCRLKLCQRCSVPHRRMRVSPHRVVDLDDEGLVDEEAGDGESGPKTDIGISCERHSDERLEMFCRDCSLFVCPMCLVVDHSTHDCVKATAAVDDLSRRAFDDVERTEAAAAKLRDESERLDTSWTEFLEQVNTTKVEIRQRADEIKKIVDERVAELLNELQSIVNLTEGEVLRYKERLQFAMAATESFVGHARDMIDRHKGGPRSELPRVVGELRATADELSAAAASAVADEGVGRVPRHVSFRPSPVDDDAVVAVVGSLSDSTVTERRSPYG
jgi:hypothetical protein